MSYIGGPLPKVEDDEENQPLGTRYVQKKREILENTPIIGEHIRQTEKGKELMKAYVKQEAQKGSVVHKVIDTLDQGADTINQALASPLTAAASLYNVHPEFLSDALYMLPFVTKGASALAKTPTAHNIAYKAGRNVRSYTDKIQGQLGLKPNIMRRPDNVNLVKAFNQEFPVNSNVSGGHGVSFNQALTTTPIKGVIPKYSSGAVVQTEGDTLYRPTKGTMSSVFAYENVEPNPTTIHDASLFTNKKAIKNQLAKWLNANEQDIYSGKVNISDFGTIIADGKKLRISSKWEDYLADSSRNLKNIQFRPGERNESREQQADPGGIKILNKNITRMNQLFTDSEGEVGLDPESLNPQIFRKGITYSARKVREFNKIIRKELGLDIQQEHPLGLAQGGTDDAMGFFLGSGKQNLALNTLEDPDAFTAESAAELGISGKANVEAAAALKGETPRHEERRQEYLQQGWLESLSNWGIKAKEIGGNPFEAYNKILLQRKKDLVSGKEIELRMPGSNVTMTDMIRIQQLGFIMDRVKAAQTVMAERAIVDAAIAAGVTDTPKGLKLLEKYIKHIDLKVEVDRAKAAEGKFRKEPKFTDVNPIYYKKTVLESQATGKLGNKPTDPLPRYTLESLKEHINKLYFNDPAMN